MTPFDATALLAMLRAFYPAVSVAALQRARGERPEYFAAGVLESTSGEKLRLPDGRLFDLIFDVENVTGQRRWQMLLVDESGAGAADPFALAPGPLRPLDLAAFTARPVPPVFSPLVAGLAAALAGAGAGLDQAHQVIASLPPASTVDGAFRALDDAAAALPGLASELDLASPAELFAQLRAQVGSIDRAQRDVTVTRPADMQVMRVPTSPPLDPSGGSSSSQDEGSAAPADASQRPDASRI